MARQREYCSSSLGFSILIIMIKCLTVSNFTKFNVNGQVQFRRDPHWAWRGRARGGRCFRLFLYTSTQFSACGMDSAQILCSVITFSTILLWVCEGLSAILGNERNSWTRSLGIKVWLISWFHWIRLIYSWIGEDAYLGGQHSIFLQIEVPRPVHWV